MKFVRYVKRSGGLESDPEYGILEGDWLDGSIRPIRGTPLSGYSVRAETLRIDEVSLKAPVTPSKIVAVGVNYRAHADEFQKSPPKEPLLFLKPPTAVIGPGEDIIHPPSTHRVDFEAELAVVIKETASHRGPDQAAKAILGYTCLNDVTARDLQKRDGQWTRAKGYDTFAPLGPCIVTDLDPSDRAIQSRLNGRLMQDARTSEMIFDVYALVGFISAVMTLLPGDVIATGTPAGVGPMKRGDQVEVFIDGIGVLRNQVI